MPSFSFILLTIFEKKNFEYIFKNLTFMSPPQPIKSSDLDKSRIKHGGLLNKHFCKKKKKNISNDLAEIVNFHFSHYKSMEILSCHSNQSSYPTEKKHYFCRRLCPKQVCQVSASSYIWFLRRRFLNIFTKIDPFCRPDNQSNTPIWTKVI